MTNTVKDSNDGIAWDVFFNRLRGTMYSGWLEYEQLLMFKWSKPEDFSI